MPLEKRPLLFNDQLFSLTSALITLTSKEMRQKDCKINFWYPYTHYHLFQFKAFLFFGIYHWCHAQEPFETSMQSYWSIRILVCKLSCETKAFTANGPWLQKKCIRSWQWKVEIALKWIPFSDIGVDIVDVMHRSLSKHLCNFTESSEY